MKKSTFTILDYILEADSDQLNRIVQAVIDRYTQIAPDWEAAFLSFPKDDPACREQLLLIGKFPSSPSPKMIRPSGNKHSAAFFSYMINKKWTPKWESILFK